MKVSVIVCTRNPRPDHLGRTLAALRAQSLPAETWELLVVDNGSAPPLASHLDLSWHPDAHVVSEPTTGLVAARLCGIGRSQGRLLVFVDDDNVLAGDFLLRAAHLADMHPRLGAFGGQVRGEFETPPTPWFARRLDRLAVREFTSVQHGRDLPTRDFPCGAGLCVRREPALAYRARVLSQPQHHALGRRGKQLASGDDVDLVLAAQESDWEIGRFPELQLLHLIPRERLTLRYFARITRSHARGELDLLALHPTLRRRGHSVWQTRLAWWKWTAIDWALSCWPFRAVSP